MALMLKLPYGNKCKMMRVQVIPIQSHTWCHGNAFDSRQRTFGIKANAEKG